MGSALAGVWAQQAGPATLCLPTPLRQQGAYPAAHPINKPPSLHFYIPVIKHAFFRMYINPITIGIGHLFTQQQASLNPRQTAKLPTRSPPVQGSGKCTHIKYAD
eukprot:scaffold224709_cov14-Tisochrysis_lutea.AAC.1